MILLISLSVVAIVVFVLTLIFSKRIIDFTSYWLSTAKYKIRSILFKIKAHVVKYIFWYLTYTCAILAIITIVVIGSV